MIGVGRGWIHQRFVEFCQETMCLCVEKCLKGTNEGEADGVFGDCDDLNTCCHFKTQIRLVLYFSIKYNMNTKICFDVFQFLNKRNVT